MKTNKTKFVEFGEELKGFAGMKALVLLELSFLCFAIEALLQLVFYCRRTSTIRLALYSR